MSRNIETLEQLRDLRPFAVVLLGFKGVPGGLAAQRASGTNQWMTFEGKVVDPETLWFTAYEQDSEYATVTVIYEGLDPGELQQMERAIDAAFARMVSSRF